MDSSTAPPASPAASVLIPTRNRRGVLLDTVASVLGQSVPVEVIVIDDGSTDGTAAAVAERFPPGKHPVRVMRYDVSAGPARRRNDGAAVATTPFLFTIDDDCLVPSARTFEQTLAAFDHPRVGAVTIPFANVRQGPAVLFRAPADGGRVHVGFDFYGGMVAFRRSAFLAAEGYRAFYFQMVEESDLAVRMLDVGHVVRLGWADPIHHLESPVRDRAKQHALATRNALLYHWYNTPAATAAVRMPLAAAATFAHSLRVGRPHWGVAGLAGGVAAVAHEWTRRRPVSRETHRLSRRLRAGSLPLDEIEPLLPAMA